MTEYPLTNEDIVEKLLFEISYQELKDGYTCVRVEVDKDLLHEIVRRLS